MPKAIEFPKTDPQWVASRSSILFFALVDGRVVRCFLSIEAMWDHFGVRTPSEDEAKRAFLGNRADIEQATRRKIETAEDSRVSEYVLRPTDFPGQTTTSTPPRVKFLTTHESPGIQCNPSLLSQVDQVNSILEQNFIRASSGKYFTADWDVFSSSGEPLVQFTLTDDETGAAVNSLFTRTDLGELTTSRDGLHRIWRDLLREKYSRLSAAVEANVDQGA